MDAGTIVRISSPFAEPFREKPNLYFFLVKERMVGVGLLRVAEPPAIESTKSSLVGSPVPEPVL